MATKRNTSIGHGRGVEADDADHLPPELEPFIEALARLFVADYDRRSQRAPLPSQPTEGNEGEA